MFILTSLLFMHWTDVYWISRLLYSAVRKSTTVCFPRPPPAQALLCRDKWTSTVQMLQFLPVSSNLCFLFFISSNSVTFYLVGAWLSLRTIWNVLLFCCLNCLCTILPLVFFTLCKLLWGFYNEYPLVSLTHLPACLRGMTINLILLPCLKSLRQFSLFTE